MANLISNKFTLLIHQFVFKKKNIRIKLKKMKKYKKKMKFKIKDKLLQKLYKNYKKMSCKFKK